MEAPQQFKVRASLKLEGSSLNTFYSHQRASMEAICSFVGVHLSDGCRTVIYVLTSYVAFLLPNASEPCFHKPDI